MQSSLNISRYFTPMASDQKVGDILVNVVSSFTENINLETFGKNLFSEIKDYDIPEFFEDLKNLISEYQKISDVLKDFSVKPVYSYDTLKEAETNAIRTQIIKRTFASVQQGAGPHQGIQMKKKILLDIVDDRLNPGYKALIYTNDFDNTLKIESWSQNYRDADKAAFLLEEMLSNYAFLFKQKGLLNLMYVERQSDLIREHANHTVYGVPLVYFVRTRKHTIVYEKILEQLIINTLIQTNGGH